MAFSKLKVTPKKLTTSSTVVIKKGVSNKELPTIKSTPNKDLSSFMYLFFGPRKIGKTSFASEFPDCLNIFTEDSGSDYSIFQVSVYNWQDIIEYVELIETHGEAGTLIYKNVSFDIFDISFKFCIDEVCKIRGCNEDNLGWGWDEVKSKYRDMINRLRRYVGVIFISHVKEKEIPRADGTKYDVMMPTAMKTAYELVSSLCDLTGFFYTNKQNKRKLRILPHNESESGNRFENHFNYKSGGKIDEIDMGITKQDAFRNFKAAFDNLTEFDSADVQDVNEVEDIDEVETSPKKLLGTLKKKGK